MTQEEKELLLKDLCARLPYNTRLKAFDVPDHDFYLYSISSTDIVAKTTKGGFICMSIEGFKPYLFPLSSMTDEQKKEYNYWKHEVPVCRYEYGDVVEEIELLDSPESFEYLIENHFDYRGLINRGLAIDCTNLNIY